MWIQRWPCKWRRFSDRVFQYELGYSSVVAGGAWMAPVSFKFEPLSTFILVSSFSVMVVPFGHYLNTFDSSKTTDPPDDRWCPAILEYSAEIDYTSLPICIPQCLPSQVSPRSVQGYPWNQQAGYWWRASHGVGRGLWRAWMDLKTVFLATEN